MKHIASIVILFAAVAIAQDKPAPKAPAVPVVSDALKAKLFKISAQQAQAQMAMQQAQETLKAKGQEWQSVVAEVMKVCGDKFYPTFDKDGDPVCTAKPDEKAPEKK